MNDKAKNWKAYDQLKELYNTNPSFKALITEQFSKGTIRLFNEEEFSKIKSQNFVSPVRELKEFIDLFILGYNIGNCVGTIRQLSYSYDNVDIVSGILPILKGSRNAEKEGGHCWLETTRNLIDTTLMLVIDKSLKTQLGYQEEQRITATQLQNMHRYQARKEFVNDPNLKTSRKKQKEINRINDNKNGLISKFY